MGEIWGREVRDGRMRREESDFSQLFEGYSASARASYYGDDSELPMTYSNQASHNVYPTSIIREFMIDIELFKFSLSVDSSKIGDCPTWLIGISGELIVVDTWYAEIG